MRNWQATRPPRASSSTPTPRSRLELQIWARAVGDRARLEFSGAFKDDSLSIDNAKLSGRAIVLSASGSVGSRAIDGRWELSLPDLSTVSAVLAGSLKGVGFGAGPDDGAGGGCQVEFRALGARIAKRKFGRRCESARPAIRTERHAGRDRHLGWGAVECRCLDGAQRRARAACRHSSCDLEERSCRRRSEPDD